MGEFDKAEKSFEKAISLSEELKLKDLHTQLKKHRLEMQGKFEAARNPYFWDDTTGK